MNRGKAFWSLWATGLFCASIGVPAASADTVYTSQSDWLAAVSPLGDVRSLSLTPVGAVSDGGATYVDDEGTLTFPDNHGDLTVSADGWFGDVHSGRTDDPTDHEPHENRFTFAAPIAAFSATVSIGEDWLADEESLLLRFGPDQTHRLMIPDYSPGFFGWVGTVPSGDLWIGSDSGNHYYRMSNVQYVPLPSAPGETHTVPLPAPATGGLALIGMTLMGATRRSRRGELTRAA